MITWRAMSARFCAQTAVRATQAELESRVHGGETREAAQAGDYTRSLFRST